MSIVTSIAIYFVIWWTVLFLVLPIGARSQIDDGEVVLGTTHSAPSRFHAWRTIVRTTLLACAVFALFYVGTQYLGLSLDSLPHIVPGT
ncbi:DUF1467 family protein [Aureimonas sp. AU20]|uniref:DUF1467 family protein n=1 Tax=Aureimonas sp. AU20 TaxID=1349819 RepID=UPI000720300D|nr:DUF1467 family protein [Aureimonas sp. AU20]ALN73392.1 hypothetical protein M673_11735 [Aureimonas sp. AU20]